MEENFENTETEMPVPDIDTPLVRKRKRSVSVGTVVLISIASIIVTAVTTFIITANAFSIKPDSTIGKIMQKMQLLDSAVHRFYVRDVDEEQLISYALKGYMYGTGDRYADYYTKEEYDKILTELEGGAKEVGVGMRVTYNEEHKGIQVFGLINGAPAEASGVKKGDIITHITVNGKRISVAEVGYNAAMDLLLGEIGTKAEFTVIRGENYSQTVDFSIERANYINTSVDYSLYTLDNSVGIIRISGFDMATPAQFKEAVENLIDKGAKAFIIDVRDNPGGELGSVCDVLDFLLPEGPIVRTVNKSGTEKIERESDKNMLGYPLAVVANGNSASAAELFTAALKDYDVATFVGVQTFGKGSMQTIINLTDGSAVKLTTNLYLPPFSPNFDGVGVTPDIEVELSDEAKNGMAYLIDEALDNQLTTAYNALKKVN